jgi:hypothetical protein
MKLNRFLLPAVMLVALFGSYMIGKATGLWQVSGRAMVESDGMNTGDDIRGWMTLAQISEGYGIPLPELYNLLGIPAHIPAATALKDMEQSIEGFEVSAVRSAVDAYRSGAALLPALDITPTPAVTPAPAAGPGEHIPSGEGGGPTPLSPGEVLPGEAIRGRHTLQEIGEQCQVPVAELLAALGLPEDTDLTMAVKDLGVEVILIRQAVTELQQENNP